MRFREKVQPMQEEERIEEYRAFLVEQINLPKDKRSERFNELVERIHREKKAIEMETETTPEESRRRTFQRYLKGLDLTEEMLRGKRILDLGCGDEGEFIQECLNKNLTEEIYGLDVEIDPEEDEEGLGQHLIRGDFEQELPIGENDLIISVGAVEAPWSEDSTQTNPEKTIREALKAIKDDGEIRIWSVRKMPEELSDSALAYGEKRWCEILKKLSEEGLIDYELRPVDISVAGRDKDVWLDRVLIIRKRK